VRARRAAPERPPSLAQKELWKRRTNDCFLGARFTRESAAAEQSAANSRPRSFGVVNLANYKGTQVAMKQLLSINDENVMRFRFECFLMKGLRHPNIVKLIGVCWDSDM
jgi:hypothetical protein